jgi:hypothetical protein
VYDENQFVAIRWSTSNREWYKSFGYKYTKCKDSFLVKARHLMPHSSAKINVQCDYCGVNYKTQYAIISNGRRIVQKDCCPHCTGKKTSDVSLRKRAEKYMSLAAQMCRENGYELVTRIEEYVDVKMFVAFRCPQHGVQTMMLDSLLHGHKCFKCSYVERGKKIRHANDYITSSIEAIGGNKLLNIEEYRDCTTHNLRIKCGLCGNIFTTSFANYVRAGVNRCHSCSCKESSGEMLIRNVLDTKNITYVQEKRFDDCRDKKPLPFDFYIPEYNLIVEFDGQHHYYPVRGEDHHHMTVRHDKIKNDYCKANGIELLRIPYWDRSNIAEIITNKFNIIGKRYSLIS